MRSDEAFFGQLAPISNYLIVTVTRHPSELPTHEHNLPGDCSDQPILCAQPVPHFSRSLFSDGVQQPPVESVLARSGPGNRHRLVRHAPERTSSQSSSASLAAVLHLPPEERVLQTTWQGNCLSSVLWSKRLNIRGPMCEAQRQRLSVVFVLRRLPYDWCIVTTQSPPTSNTHTHTHEYPDESQQKGTRTNQV